MGEALNKILYSAGLSRRTRTEHSGELEAVVEILKKDYKTVPFPAMPEFMSRTGPHPLASIVPCYFVQMRWGGDVVERCDESFYRFANEGDLVKLTYTETFEVTSDFVPPDFSEKKVAKEKVGYNLLEFEKVGMAKVRLS